MFSHFVQKTPLGGSFTSKPSPSWRKALSFFISSRLNLRLDCFFALLKSGLWGKLYKQATTLLAQGAVFFIPKSQSELRFWE
ncbi:hypothetical protein BST99_13920 [Aureicoccus marinus]|uniref:Uncharacterized protein n=1 Tax=Aureicoccus marinus TaxID=754435 RepID=A0A2S7T9Q4_9FLAO|nr:hypothetical protein BST99_13920 [Aureicoccus marinus]